MLKKISILITLLFLFYACKSSDEGAVKSIADLEKRVSKVNSMNTELEKQRNELYTLVRQFNANLPETEKYDITHMDTLMSLSERELLKAMFKEEKDISYNGLLRYIIEKNNKIVQLQQNIADLEANLPKPYTVKRGDTHYQIVIQYLMLNYNMTKNDAHKVAWKTALIDDILPGNKIWLMYQDGMVGSFVTQGDAKISPLKVMMMARKRMIEKAKSITSLENSGKSIAGN